MCALSSFTQAAMPVRPVHLDLYLASTDDAFDITQALSVLDEYELSRYRRFKVEHARQTFLLARYIIKTELACRLDIAPAEVRFDYNQNGKPQLIPDLARQDLHFSLAHSQSTVLVAISSVTCGVDVEELARLDRVSEDTATFVGERAAAQIANLAVTPEQHRHYFAMFWTSMESIVKLRGSTLYAEQAIFDLRLNGNTYEFTQNDYAIASFLVDDVVVSVCVASELITTGLKQWRCRAEYQYPSYTLMASTGCLKDGSDKQIAEVSTKVVTKRQHDNMIKR